ncbi:MAG: FAD-dependent pyridine nucleotide-disulfide oxidoreductase [Parcubacteria group bacterium GW2011_GWB1_52_7]|nr:MAG: FAD-dependent pyridine nucleotide-disulfide oxidoreductase [Parcubacteria group bacterium GW2011_GWB1_52_7]
METTKKKIVIAGAGFGGITAALFLNKAFSRNPKLRREYQIIIVNNHHSHLYTPAIYEIAAIPQGRHALDYVKSSITIPLADIFHRTLLRFDNDETLGYEYLVLALGAETSYFNIPGAKEHSYPLKTFADAVKLRDRIQDVIEANEAVARIVVVGGGASGVEVAAEFENFIRVLHKKDHAPSACKIEVTLAEAGPEILAGFDKWVIDCARQRLGCLNVAIKTNTAITAVEKDQVMLKGSAYLPYTVLVWAGGVQAASVLKTLGMELTPKQSVPVNSYLEVEPKLFAIGDNAAFINPSTSRPLPWNALVAESQAKIAASNILADIKGKTKRLFYPLKKYPFILAAGRKYAIADLVFIHEAGFTAWILKLLVELKYLLFILPFFAALSIWWKYISVARSND